MNTETFNVRLSIQGIKVQNTFVTMTMFLDIQTDDKEKITLQNIQAKIPRKVLQVERIQNGTFWTPDQIIEI